MRYTPTRHTATNLHIMTKVFILCAMFILLPMHSLAQFTSKSQASKVETYSVDTAVIKVAPPTANLQFQLYSDAYDRYLKKLLFKRRNSIKSAFGLYVTQTALENWAAGGSNSFSGRATAYFEHNYIAEVFSVKTVFNGKYGLIRSDQTMRKNEDNFDFTTVPSWNISKHWKLSGAFTWRSQFSNSYRPPGDTILVSGFMAPGTIEISAGLTYESVNKKFNLLLSPVAGKFILVLNKDLANQGGFGIDITQGSQFFKAEIGARLTLNYGTWFAKEKIQYVTKFDSFWNYVYTPTVWWENKVNFKFTNIFSANFYALIIYNDQIRTPKAAEFEDANPGAKVNHLKYIQINESFGFGLVFNLASKPHEPIKESTITRSRLKYSK